MQRTLQKLFAAEEYFCAVAADPEQTRLALRGPPFDLVVLDVGQPHAERLELLRQIRRQHHTPVLVLAPDHDVADTVAGLEGGADDYLCEPFDPRELVARVRAQLRRGAAYREPHPGANRMDLGSIVLDVDQGDAFREGKPLHLTRREFDVLHLLARHRGKALASSWIFENVWGYDAELGPKVLGVTVGRLRRKIEADPRRPQLLVNLRGFGYKLLSPAG